MNPYQVLGVPKDAPTEEIKAAFRREASKAHPDREGGSTERMTQLNEAHAVLSDPQRRRRFDETGSAEQVPSIEAEARAMLAAIFTKALEQDRYGIVEFARNDAVQVHAQLAHHREAALANVRQLEARRPKVRTTGSGDNLVHDIIDQQLTSLRENIVRIGRGLEVVEFLNALLGVYDEDAPAPPPSFLWTQAPGTQSATWG